MTNYINEGIFLAIIIATAKYQAYRMDKLQKTIHHGLWDIFFGALIFGGWLISHKDWWFAGALTMEHFLIFGPCLSLMRTPRRAYFYVHGTSFWDRIMIAIDGWYKLLYALVVGGFIFIQFKL